MGRRIIRRRCGCGCGEITTPGSKWILGHRVRKMSKETKLKLSIANKDKKLSKEHRIKISLGNLRSHPDDDYCEAWRDREYKKDLRKDYCENENCKNQYKKLDNHHINLNKKNCGPHNIMTLCKPCHMHLHRQLEQVANQSDILTINRTNYIHYINKRTRQVIATIIRIKE